MATPPLSAQDCRLLYPGFKSSIESVAPGTSESDVQKLFHSICALDEEKQHQTSAKIRKVLDPQEKLLSAWIKGQVRKFIGSTPAGASKETAIKIASDAMGKATQAAMDKKKETCTQCNNPNQLVKTGENTIAWTITKCCKFAKYCSKACQRADWPSHKTQHKKAL